MLLSLFGPDVESAAVAGGDTPGEEDASPCGWVPGSETMLLSPPPLGFLRAQEAFSAEKQFFKLNVTFETALGALNRTHCLSAVPLPVSLSSQPLLLLPLLCKWLSCRCWPYKRD